MSTRTYLRSLAPGPIHYKPNPGNAGDAVLAHTTYRLFEQEGIDVRIWSEGDDPAGKVIVYGGGGNFVEHYDHASTFIAANHRHAERLVILPHTISGHTSLLSSFGSNVVVFCREPRTYRYVQEQAPKADVRLEHDVALEMEVQEVLATRPRQRFPDHTYRHTRRDFRSAWSRRRLREGFARLWRRSAPRTLHAFREDVEQTDLERPEGNIDLSASLPVEWEFLQPVLAHETTAMLLECIGGYDRVLTNRLHVGICAALLGKRVHLYDNAYWKNRAVYEHSLATRFPNLSFESTPRSDGATA